MGTNEGATPFTHTQQLLAFSTVTTAGCFHQASRQVFAFVMVNCQSSLYLLVEHARGQPDVHSPANGGEFTPDVASTAVDAHAISHAEFAIP